MIKNRFKLKLTIYTFYSTVKFQSSLVNDYCGLYEIPGLRNLSRYDYSEVIEVCY